MNYLGENIRILRKERSLSIAELAKLSKASPSSISQIENGKRDATFKLILNIANALDIKVGELVTPINENSYEHDIYLAIRFSTNENLIFGESGNRSGHKIKWLGVFNFTDDIELTELLYIKHNRNADFNFNLFFEKSLYFYLIQQRLRILLWNCVNIDKSYLDVKSEGIDWLSLKQLLIDLSNRD